MPILANEIDHRHSSMMRSPLTAHAALIVVLAPKLGHGDVGTYY